MDGYSTSSVSALPDHHQVLTGQAVETAADGSLVVRFKRPFAASFPPLHEDACVPMAVVAAVKAVEGQETGGGAAETEGEGGGGGEQEGTGEGEKEEKVGGSRWAEMEEREGEEQGTEEEEEGGEGDGGRWGGGALALEAAAVCSAEGGGVERLDPREEGMVLLWAYASRASWPSYHDATGAFPLPSLGFESYDLQHSAESGV